METPEIPSNFRSVVVDFATDLSTTFPEFSFLWAKWIDPQLPEPQLKYLFEYCLSIFPERFFDFLYQNEEIFYKDSTVNTFFLPDVDFKLLYNCDNVSEHTKKSLWKYLQLLLFTIVGSTKDKANFGETVNLFDGVEEETLQEKMKETMESIGDFFKNITKNDSKKEENGQPEASSEHDSDSSAFPDIRNMFGGAGLGQEGGSNGLPNMENINEHLKKLFQGKIGSLAKEMAEEISGEFVDLLGGDTGELRDTKDVIKKLMQNPKKIMELMKTVGAKLDTKMKTGEISREEIMKEASELFGSMKEMGDNKQFMEMFKNLSKMGGMPGMPPGMNSKNAKVDVNAMNRMSKQQATRERLRKKVEEKREQLARETALKNTLKPSATPSVPFSLNPSHTPNTKVFRLEGEESQEKSYIHPDILKEMENMENSKPGAVEDKKKPKKKNKSKK
jgi:hypothetical protein